MRARTWRRIFVGLTVVAVLLAIGTVAVHLSLPAVVRWQVRGALARMGYRNATFDVESASAFGAHITNIRAGEKGQLNVSSLRVAYAPLRAAMGRIDTIKVDRANITIDLDDAVETGDTEFDLWATLNPQGLPLWRIELNDTAITLRRGERQYAMQADGWLWRTEADRARASLALRFASAPAWIEGTMRFDSRSFEFTFSAVEVDLATIRPFLPVQLREHLNDVAGKLTAAVSTQYAHGRTLAQAQLKLSGGRVVTSDEYGVTLEGLATDVVIDSLYPLRARAGQHVDVAKLSMGEHALTNVHFEFGLPALLSEATTQPSTQQQEISPAALAISELRFNWAGGEIRTTAPALIDLREWATELRLGVERVGLNEFLRLLTSGKATGDGTLSGELPVNVRWPVVWFGNGIIASDAPGNINFGQQVGELATTIAERDPRLKGQGDQLMAALTNFHYDQIEFEFDRSAEGLEVSTRLAGRGTKGTTTPLDVTVRNVGLEEALNTYLVARFGVNNSDD